MHGNIFDGLSRINNPQSTSFVLLTVVNYLARKSKAVLRLVESPSSLESDYYIQSFVLLFRGESCWT
jgi:hypothetical protein